MEAVVMRRVAPLSVVSVLALIAACTSSPGTVSTSTSGGAAVSPSVTATPTLATGVATPTPDPNLDATTHARVHVVALDHGGANVDMFVDGATANNGGQAQVNVHTGYVTAYLYLAPGTHRVAVVPTGTAAAQAGQAAVDVPVAAGHRYVVAFPPPIPGGECQAPRGRRDRRGRTGRGNPGRLGVHHPERSGRDDRLGLHVGRQSHQRRRKVRRVRYRHCAARGRSHHGDGQGYDRHVLIDEKNYSNPGNSVFGAFGTDATSPGSREVVDGAPTSEQNLLDSLHAYDANNVLPGSGYPGGSLPSFTTVLAAIKTAGMTDLYTGGATLLFLPPTDRAFAVLPQVLQRDALLADPAALAVMLRSHTIGAYVPRAAWRPRRAAHATAPSRTSTARRSRSAATPASTVGPEAVNPIGSPTAHTSIP